MSTSESLIGSVLDGKYKVDRLLGRGGMGEVYAGTHLRLERTVAIKVLHGDLSDNASFVARFAREARTAAKLEHPNAVHVYDFGSLEDGSTYLVMEFIEGVTLREVLRANGRLDPGTAIDLVRQAAGAVGAAHARGIVHRDLKPENMMVRQDESGKAVLKVVDFGLAKMLENTTSQLTNKSELIGTPKYMAPEQFQAATVDGRADVYALGCVLFELLAGRTPFEGTFIEIVGKHVYADVPMVADFGVELPTELEAVIRQALQKDPEQRLATASEFVRELDAVAGTSQLETAALTIPIRAADTAAAGGAVPAPDEGETLRAPEGLGAENDDPLRTQRDPRLATPAGDGNGAERATVVVPAGHDATQLVGRGKVTRPGVGATPNRPGTDDEETAALPTRLVALPATAARSWIVPAAIAMSAVVVVAAWQGFGAGGPQPASTNAPLPVAPVAVSIDDSNSNSRPAPDAAQVPAVDDTDLGPETDTETVDADEAEVDGETAAPAAPRAPRPPAAKPAAEVEPVPPTPEVHEMRPTPDPRVDALTPVERRRLRKLAERERRRREAIREGAGRP